MSWIEAEGEYGKIKHFRQDDHQPDKDMDNGVVRHAGVHQQQGHDGDKF